MLLTIAIPTFKRYDYLEKNLDILFSEISNFKAEVEVIVLDNNFDSSTPSFINKYINLNLIEYIKNPKNIGSDLNIAKSYKCGTGQYILTLGDDDFFLPGMLANLLALLRSEKYNIVLLRSCGFDDDYINDVPLLKVSQTEYKNSVNFLFKCSANSAFISALVINRSKLKVFNPYKYEGSNLIQLGVYLEALSLPGVNLVTHNYYISAKRNNTGGYNSYDVFVLKLKEVFKSNFSQEFSDKYLQVLLNSLTLKFYPQRVYVDLKNNLLSDQDKSILRSCLSGFFGYYLLIFPMIKLPRFLGVPYGKISVILSRILAGDLARILWFLYRKIIKFKSDYILMEIIKSWGFVKLESFARNLYHKIQDVKFFICMPLKSKLKLLKYFFKSNSQLKQDLFVLATLNFKKRGYFVEFGATNGIKLSNTFLLEDCFDWSGLLSEPARCWHDDLFLNRKCKIETKCIWSITGDFLEFCQVDIPELSTIKRFQDIDSHDRVNKLSYLVETLSLNDFLIQNNAPKYIDYLSIDTEGSEFEILNNFDFDKFTIKIITCEHNFTENRQKIHSLLSSKGYKRIYKNLSRFDDWYILE